LQILGDEDGDDERVDGENTGHNDGDEALSRAGQRGRPLKDAWNQPSHLHDQVWPEGSHACNTNAGFRGAISRARACELVSGQLSVGTVGGVVVWFGAEGSFVQPKIMAAAMPACMGRRVSQSGTGDTSSVCRNERGGGSSRNRRQPTTYHANEGRELGAQL
jgi:hypothetical protein